MTESMKDAATIARGVLRHLKGDAFVNVRTLAIAYLEVCQKLREVELELADAKSRITS